MAHGDIYAPDFPKDSIWLNTDRPLFLADLKGQVVLLDFWTYCCINCLHVLPDLKYLENKFKKEPFLVIGVHAAKFFNEKNVGNILAATQRHDIEHPVVVDNNHVIWESYAVSAWPSFVFIDAGGRIRGSLSGEGRRWEMETVIRQLLDEGKKEGVLASGPLRVTKKRTPPPTTLSFPGKITLDEEGRRLFIADSNHNRILICHFHSPTEAHLLAAVGSGRAADNDGVYEEASFNYPQGLCLVGENLYVCDTGNNLIRRIRLTDRSVDTVAGREIKISSPWDLGYAEGYLYIAMAGSHQIWSLRLADNLLQPFAGSGWEGLVDGNLSASQLAQPSGISVDQENLYFVDSEASSLRVIDLKEDEVKTLIGRGLFDFGYQDGPFETAFLQHPLGLFAAGKTVFLADTYNQAIRKADLPRRELSTLIGRGKGEEACRREDQSCEALPLWEPGDVEKRDNFLFLADTNNHLIRVFDLEKSLLTELQITMAGPLIKPEV